jgi:glutathione S-transferase
MASPAGASWSVVLDDEHAPPSSTPERREYLSWLFFAVTKLQPAVLEVFMCRGNSSATKRARAAFDVHAKEIEKALSRRQVLVGDVATAADKKIASVLAWAASLGLLERYPRLRDHAHRYCP